MKDGRKVGLMALATVAVLGLLTAGVSGASRASAEPVFLVGQITDARTGEPIEEVQVLVEGDRLFTATNSEGGFRLEAGGSAAEFQLTLRHPCYHTVRVEVDAGTETRRIRLGMPFDYEKYEGVSRPLGGCR